MDAIPYIDFLFGNEIEAASLAASEGWDGLSLEEVALKVWTGLVWVGLGRGGL